MSNARKNKPERPPKVCAFPGCEASFVPSNGRGREPIYCEDHRNRHAKQQVDRRSLGASERPAGYYQTKICAFEGCEVEFEPRTGSARYCDEHQATDHWKLANPEKAAVLNRRKARRSRHKKMFGDPDIYEKLVELYGERCAICGAEPKEDFHLAVDHHHGTGAFRGLLCPPHNTGLGYFSDDPALLRAAADFLERPSLAV